MMMVLLGVVVSSLVACRVTSGRATVPRLVRVLGLVNMTVVNFV